MRELEPNTAPDPLMHLLFNEQERRKISTRRLAELTGINPQRLGVLRQPRMDIGKTPRLFEVRLIAKALGFVFPDTLRKNGD